MNPADERSAEWYLIVIATVADVAGILSFIGFQANCELQLVVAGTLALIGALAAAVTLLKALLLWLSPAGSYIPRGNYVKAFSTGSIALLVSLAIAVAFLASTRGHPCTSPPSPKTPVPSSSFHS
jgi:hypothetical protein